MTDYYPAANDRDAPVTAERLAVWRRRCRDLVERGALERARLYAQAIDDEERRRARAVRS